MNTPDSTNVDNKVAYDARWQRIMDCVALKQPDRMPTALYPMFWLAKLGGISYRQLMYDYEKAAELGERGAPGNLTPTSTLQRSLTRRWFVSWKPSDSNKSNGRGTEWETTSPINTSTVST